MEAGQSGSLRANELSRRRRPSRSRRQRCPNRRSVRRDPGDQTSILKFAERLFGLPTLASLPDEQHQPFGGARDANPAIGDLLAGFDPARLNGSVPPLAPASAEIPDDVVNSFPARMNCRSLGMTPVALPNASAPANFDPRPPRPRRTN